MDPADVTMLDSVDEAVMAVGDDGRIAYANAGALALLGWDGALIGQPLQAIIPARLRQRHLEGFGRYLRTGESRLQGGTVRVPALLRDGSEEMVDLTIRVFRRPDGTKLALASMSKVEVGHAPPGLRLIEDELTKRLYQLI